MLPTFRRPATLEDVLDVSKRLREADRQEVLASVGMEPEHAFPFFFSEGKDIHCAGLNLDGRPEVLWGFDPIEGVPGAAVAWLVSSPRIYEHPVEFTINARDGFNEAHERYELLTNFIDARNERHLKWLKWMGFKFIRRIEHFGAQSLPFIEFASYRPCALWPQPPS